MSDIKKIIEEAFDNRSALSPDKCEKKYPRRRI